MSGSIRGRMIERSQVKLRKQLWPDIDENSLWNKKENKGFTNIPRTMPLILYIMNSLSKNKPISSTYFELWCRAFDPCMVTIGNPEEHAFHAGFTGQRAENLWKHRIDILTTLKFIDVKPGPAGAIGYVLIFNPYDVIKRHYEEHHPGINDRMFNALIGRAIQIGANDLDQSSPEE